MNVFKQLIALVLVVAFAGCTDYLDVVPDERPTEADAFKNIYAAENFLYSCYSYIPNPRSGTGSIDFMTADEVVTAFEHETFANFPKGNFTASNPVISYWNTLFKGIRQCYLLIDGIDQTPGLSDQNKTLYKAEAKFLIAYYHFLLARNYGPTIIVDGVADINTPFEDFPSRAHFDDVIDFIAKTFDEAAAELPVRYSSTSAYGRATSIAAKALKARALLMAASPLFNGGGEDQTSFYTDFKDEEGNLLISTTYNPEKWKRAADAASEAIQLAEANGHALYSYNESLGETYPLDETLRDLRYTFIDRYSQELLWADTRNEGTYELQNKSTPFIQGRAWNGVAPTLTMVESFYTENGLPIDVDPNFDYDNRYAIATGPNGTTLNLNLHREPRFDAWVGYHNSYYEIIRDVDGEVVEQIKTQFRKNDNCGINGRSNNYTPTGYLNKKGVHPKLEQPTLMAPSQQYPWPVIRLADLYLIYAEALIEYGSATEFATAKEYIDRVRTRAGIPTIDEAWGVVGGASTKETLRRIVRDERTIELYLENQRFWDLRRWMIAEDYLGVQAKGMNIQGATDDEFFRVTTVPFQRQFRSPAFYLMPIPQSEINKNEKLVQNPGY
ncbi:RagB/SusD family nutrient uptake outer membrane protein [Mangrovibacterium marinum]|uniref:Putative outer membrane starch-binding protein n=1 Tax=Mangrovibacterium marinum TaxID=1639118 RepID=A0A2T5BZL2_9BACT|nr:RagB/SusD family nutrient uptake outer membrane protein [Mangrovibacterium marinum]PTN07723.1 putative outer membrane starch-binding protein [Mangrovibacterium marinum]